MNEFLVKLLLNTAVTFNIGWKTCLHRGGECEGAKKKMDVTFTLLLVAFEKKVKV